MSSIHNVEFRPDAARLLDAAQNLHGNLSERLEETEQTRKIPEQTVAELREAELFRVFQPQRFGGTELSMAEVLPIIVAIAEACPSTAWVLAVHQIHQWIVGLFPNEAQDEVFGDDNNTLLSGVLQPRVKVARENDGYRIAEGRWVFASGCDYANWVHIGGLLMSESGPPAPQVFLIPKSDFQILDDWHVTGLRGTGSKSITVQDLYIPAHHSISFMDAISGAAGAGKSALYQSAFAPMLSLNVTAPALGAVRTAIDVFKQHIETRNMPFSQNKQADSAITHRQLAQVMMKTDVAELLLDRASRMVRDYAERGEVMPLQPRLTVRLDSSYAVRQCLEAVNELCQVSGGGILQNTHPLQRLQHDIHAMTLHAALNLDANFEMLGAATLGRPLGTNFV